MLFNLIKMLIIEKVGEAKRQHFNDKLNTWKMQGIDALRVMATGVFSKGAEEGPVALLMMELRHIILLQKDNLFSNKSPSTELNHS